MQNEILYKGYLIKAVPSQVADTKKWTINVQITKDYRSLVYESYIASITWDTRDDAIKGSINLGIQIIDGKFPDIQFSWESTWIWDK